MPSHAVVLVFVKRAVVTLAVLAAIAPPAVTVAAFAATPVADARADGLTDFQARLNAYLKMRHDLEKTIAPLSPTPSAAELAARQASLAAAIRAARRGAKPGDVIPRAAAEQIAKVVLEDFHIRNPQIKRSVLEEVPSTPRPVINRGYPESAALPTMPPLLLKNLPRLPDNLQYRFFGRHVVLLDGDTQIIVDSIANVLPPH
jgi:hypothetical protein